MDLYVIGDEETVLGFRLAGLRGKVVEDTRQARETLQEVTAREETKIVLVTEQIANEIRQDINTVRFGEGLPIIVEIPGPEGPSEQSPQLVDLIREAVGIKL